MKECIKNSIIFYEEYLHTNLNLTIEFLKKIIIANDLSMNFILYDSINFDLNDSFVNLDNGNKNMNLFFQIEHNLVLPGGRDCGDSDTKKGNVKSIYDDDCYLVRIPDLEHYHKFDFIIEYSLPNIHNIILSGSFSDTFINNIIYIPPLLFEYSNVQNDRDINVLTSFIDTNQPRRKNLLDNLEENKINNTRMNGFDIDKLKGILDRTKILVNVHQTEHHHTLEEFRILPALLRGVVVISENIPLKEKVPYHKYIIWCDFKDIINTIRDVSKNHSSYFNKIHGDESQLKEIFLEMKSESYKDLATKVMNWITDEMKTNIL